MKRYLAIFILSVLLLPFAGCSNARTKSLSCYNKGLVYISEGKTNEAFASFKKAIELYSKNIPAQQKYQDLNITGGKATSIQNEYKEKLKSNPKDPVYHYLFGRFLGWSKGKDHFQKSVTYGHKFPWGYYGLGMTLLEEKKYPDAIAEFQKAIDLDDNIADFHIQLGRTYAMTGKLNDAESEFRKAVDIDSKNPEGLFYLGNISMIAGNVNEAEINYEKALALDPSSSKYKNALGKVYLIKGKMKEAFKLFNEISKKDPDNQGAVINLARVLYLEEKNQEAIKIFKRSLQINPDSPEAHYLLALAYMGDKNWTEAEYELKAVEKLNGTYPGIHKARALINLCNGSEANAENELSLEEKISKSDPEIYYIRGQILFRQFKILKAEEQFKMALSINSRYYPAYLGLGQIEEYFKEYVRAIRVYEGALVLFPNDVEIMYRMGRCYSLHGDDKPAIEYFGKAFKSGMDDWNRIDEDMALQGLKGDPQMADMLSKKRKKAVSKFKHSQMISNQELIYYQIIRAYKKS